MKPTAVTAFKFGDTADRLAMQVVEGIKTATCSGHVFYELEKMPLPQVGEFGIVLNRADEPVAIIETLEVSIFPINEITEEFALAEGDGSYENWRNIHVNYFSSELQKYGAAFSEDMLLVCERFKRIDGGI